MPRQQYRVTLLVTLDDQSEVVRTVKVEAWSANDAIRIAEEMVRQEDDVVEARAQNVE
jgi:capsule polysaccharide export protein KpsE/RkpR